MEEEMSIDARAIVGKAAKIGKNVEIGPYAIVEDGAEIGDDVKIWPHAYICNGTSIGEKTQIHMGAVIGHIPQDIAFKNGKTYLKIGKRSVIREYATIHRGTQEGTATVIGDDCYLMAVAHVGHNCQIGDKVIIVNGALLAGYVTVEDSAFISGNVVIHQFCRVGRLAMIGGYTGVNKDVPPYMLVRGPSVVRSVNLVGLRRAKFSRELISDIKDAFKLLYLSKLTAEEAIGEIKKLRPSEELNHLSEFIQGSKRGFCKYKESSTDFFE